MQKVAIFAGGCFWCTEAIFLDIIGVVAVESGYTGGTDANPTYEEVCRGSTGHAEAVRIVYDPSAIGYDELLDIFFATHDPTQLNRQGNDVGTQYRSAIFAVDGEQAAAARAAIDRAQGDWADPIVTTIEPFDVWYAAESYHHDYFARVGDRNPYCTAVIAPKLRKFRKSFAARLKG